MTAVEFTLSGAVTYTSGKGNAAEMLVRWHGVHEFRAIHIQNAVAATYT